MKIKKYICFETGEVWTEDELREIYREIYETEEDFMERFPTFEEYLENALYLGRQRISGLIEIEE